MLIRLIMTNKETNQWVHMEGADEYFIGREDGDLVISDPKCSRKHASFKVDEAGGLWLRDLNSSNGTIVNQVKVNEIKLKLNDVIKIGSTVLLLLEFETEVLKPGSKASVHFTTVDEGGPRATEAPVKRIQDQTPSKKGTRQIAPLGSELLQGWPNNIRSLTKDALENFVDHIDSEQRKKSKRLIEILEARKKKAS